MDFLLQHNGRIKNIFTFWSYALKKRKKNKKKKKERKKCEGDVKKKTRKIDTWK